MKRRRFINEDCIREIEEKMTELDTRVDRLVNNGSFVEEFKDKWVRIFDMLSYIGFSKNELYKELDEKYGSKNWLPAHFFDGEPVSRLKGYEMYDEAYYEFLKNNPEVREWIVNTASEVMDFAESNIECGLDLGKQEEDVTHLQDISVRRALTRLKLEDEGKEYDIRNLPVIPIFKGDHIVQIREHTTEGFVLNPGQVPFHKPELGLDTLTDEWREKTRWWKKDSAEDVYQRNKVLLVNPESLELRLAMVTEDSVFLAESDKVYYELRLDDINQLHYRRGKDVRRRAQFGELGEYCEIKDAPNQKFSELQELAVQHLTLKTELDKKRLSLGHFRKRLMWQKRRNENPPLDKVEFDIQKYTEKDPFELEGKYGDELAKRYVGNCSLFAGIVLQLGLASESSCAGGDVVSSYIYKDGSQAAAKLGLKKKPGYYVKFYKGLGERHDRVKQLKNVLDTICERDYEKVDELDSNDVKLRLEYKSDRITFVYMEYNSGKTAFSYDRVIKGHPEMPQVHVKKMEK